MTIEEHINYKLRATSAVTTYVGTRIRPLAFTQLDGRPCIAYQVTGTEQFDNFQSTADWRKAVMTIDIFADSYKKCVLIAATVRAALNNYSATLEDCVVGVGRHKDDNNASEPPDVGEEKPIYRLQSNYIFLYKNT